MTPTISLIVPVFNEAPSLAKLYREISDVLDPPGARFEIIFVNDGSLDATARIIEEISADGRDRVRAIHFSHNQGKALGLAAGFRAARGEILITMDGDLQDDPKEIPRFIAALGGGRDLVCGWKRNRKDTFIKNSSSKFYNIVASFVSGVHLHDHNCGFKAYRRDVALALPLTGQLHRYVPMLARARGFIAITEIVVNHRVRAHGKSKYGFSRYLNGVVGLCHALWLAKGMRREQHNRLAVLASELPQHASEVHLQADLS